MITARRMGLCSGTILVAEGASGNDQGRDSYRKEGPGHEKIRSASLHCQVDRPSPIVIGQQQVHLRYWRDLCVSSEFENGLGYFRPLASCILAPHPIFYGFLFFYGKI